MKLDEVTVLWLGFREMYPPRPDRKTYVLEKEGFVVLLDYCRLGSIDETWFFEKVEVETVADIMKVCYELGQKHPVKD
jgi:hypothetical protein